MNLLKRVENEVVRPLARWARPSRRVNLGGIDIRYRSELDGGGTDFGQEFIPFLKSRECPGKIAYSSGAAVQRLLAFRCWGTAFVKLSVYPTSIQQRWSRVEIPCAPINLAIARPFISRTI
jgi:hypothetical protein